MRLRSPRDVRAPRALRGLRPRLIAACVAVAVLAAATASWASAASASNSLLRSTQQRIADTAARGITDTAPALVYPPDTGDLRKIRDALDGPVVVTYESLRVQAGETAAITEQLRTAVHGGDHLALQRVDSATGMKLLVGMPVLITGVDGQQRPSGIEVYLVRDLGEVVRQVNALTRNAIWTSALALPVAVLLALLAARGVLRPVRELRGAARKLAAGDLDARLRPSGADELAELATTFNDTAASLQSSISELARMEADSRRFVADVSHELRTPLTTLTSVAEMLEEDLERMPSDARASIELAIAETRRLASLVEDLMEIARFDAGAAQPHLERVDVPGVVRECLRSRSWTGQVRLDSPEELAAVLDRRRLDVIVANLVGNALRHGDPPVVVRLSADEQELHLEVIDNGPGLPEGIAAQLFDRFYKADSSRGRSAGSGLGMAITAENVWLHGGTIEAGNTDSAGARFAVTLPRWSEET
ncbi:HAMP domain-containing sensor histidine kinase [Prauserella halophila]|uniref:histidine kinase n=1 Tax=Prauserella halophila TaxID=185641 RepID=A0ABP4GVX4_9PSEU|nr:HAMP domain-containing sensor histidine kinase [Prauserella halophila]MCP2235842.1 two-component system, OmpR family, sensor histidine kinase MtrB [Prauserella halophila]